MPREKYRVHEVAKDFGLNSKKILAILDTHMPAERTHMAALEDRELDLIFETVTQENSVASFDAYFHSELTDSSSTFELELSADTYIDLGDDFESGLNKSYSGYKWVNLDALSYASSMSEALPVSAEVGAFQRFTATEDKKEQKKVRSQKS